MRILVVIANYGTQNNQYLGRLLAEYRSMPHKVDIVVLSNLPKNLGPKVETRVGLPSKNPWSLPFSHKRIFAERVNDYDLFIYSEDDTLITERHLEAFLKVSAVLPGDEIPGFLRFEVGPDGQRNYCDVHGNYHWDPQSIRSRGDYTFAFFTNEHAACYVLTRDHLKHAIDSGGFLVEPHEGKYDLLCTAATDPYTQCGFQKLICISHLNDFLVHHLPNKYVGSTFGVDDPELRRQVETLLRIGRNGHRPPSLFNTETKLRAARYSKDYYEPVAAEAVLAIPQGVQTVLSIGCGWGATEVFLVEKGLQVVAVPLDPVIATRAKTAGVEMISGDFQAAQAKLAGRKFDCLLVLNVLHLVQDPVGVLSIFGNLLGSGSVAIISAPNLKNLSVIAGRVLGDERLKDLGNYDATATHATSQACVRRWCEAANLKVLRVFDIARNRAEMVNRATLGLFGSLLASEFIVAATKP